MTVTVLAVLSMTLLLVLVILGYKGVIKRGRSPQSIHEERCTICGGQFRKTELVERQIGDYRLYFFCASCITSLYDEIVRKN